MASLERRKVKLRLLQGLAAIIACAVAVAVSIVSAQGLPNLPLLYHGRVYVEGVPTPDGLRILARIVGCGYESPEPVEVKDGRYARLEIAPEGTACVNKTISFYATYGVDEVRALDTALYRPPDLTVPGSLTPKRDLLFPRLPTLPPTPTPTPTLTPTPTPTMTPTPTAALPIPGDPAVRSASLWVLVVGIVALMAGAAVLGLARARTR